MPHWLRTRLRSEKAAGKRIFPAGSEWFRALDLTPLEQVRVVILGQDPYHGEGQAHGLCFSVRRGVRTPPSLVNIYKEMQTDLGIPPARHGFLEHWAQQGVLLLNSVLTVRMGQAASHRERGWERVVPTIRLTPGRKPRAPGTPAAKRPSAVEARNRKLVKRLLAKLYKGLLQLEARMSPDGLAGTARERRRRRARYAKFGRADATLSEAHRARARGEASRQGGDGSSDGGDRRCGRIPPRSCAPP